MYNRTTLVGRLTRDIALRHASNGTAYAFFTVAVDRPPVENREKVTDFIDCLVWAKAAEAAAKHGSKGRLVLVEGRLEVYQREKDGQRQRDTRVRADFIRWLDTPRERAEADSDAPDDLPF